MTPTAHVGIDVWYSPNPTTVRAAKVTALHPEKEGVVSLAVFGLSELSFRQDIPYSKLPASGCWSFVG